MFADSTATLPTEPAPRRTSAAWQFWSIPVAFLLGSALSIGMFIVSSNSERQRIHSEFERSAAAFVAAMQARTDDIVQLLDSLVGLHETSVRVSPDQFERFSEHLFEHHDGIQAMEWAPRVRHGQRDSHEQEAAAQGMARYVISERGVDGNLVPAADREEYFPVYFVEPLSGNEPAVGYDLGSDPVRRAAITRAAEVGDSVGTGRIRLVQERGEQFAILVVHAVYPGGSVPDSPDDRQDAMRGVMLLVLRIGDLVDSVIRGLGMVDIRVALYDESAPTEQSFLHEYTPGDATLEPAVGSNGKVGYSRTLQLASRTWRIVCIPMAGSLSAKRTWLPWGLLISGLMVSTLLAGVLQLVTTAGRQAERHAAAISKANIALQQQMEQNVRLLEEARLKEEEARKFALLVENSDDFVGMATLDGAVLFVNRAGRELVGLDPHTDLASLTLEEFLTEEGQRASAETEVPAVKSRGHWSGEATLRHFQSGESIPVLVNSFLIQDPETGEPVALATVQRDIRERKRALEELYHTQKLESLGVLAGGIAHDFNNLLVAVLGNAELARRSLPPASPAQESLVDIEKAAQRLAELSRQMLAYSGRGHVVVEPVDLSALVKEMSPIVTAALSKKALLEYRLESDLPAVDADATQLRQVVLNLIVNASEALGERTGHITVSTGVRLCSRDFLSATYVDDDLTPGSYVFMEVADTGTGMEAEVRGRIFEPFFTTKFAGRGLGLAAALGIVRAHKGAISVNSKPGAGTTFQFLIPASARPTEPAKMKEGTSTWRGSGVVLLADDEDSVRRVAESMLRTLGFDVLIAVDGRDAVRLFSENRAVIVACLLDRTMPALDGLEALREIHNIDADIPIILSSGYSREDLDDSMAAGFVQKPYTLAALEDALRRGLA